MGTDFDWVISLCQGGNGGMGGRGASHLEPGKIARAPLGHGGRDLLSLESREER